MEKDLFKIFFFTKNWQKYTFCTKAAIRGGLKERVLKTFLQIEGETPVFHFFDKNTGLRPATLIRKRLQQRCFAVNFVNFSRTPFLQNTSRWLLLFVIYLTVSFCKEILHICSNLLLEKSSKTHDLTIFSFCKYILYPIL